MIRSSPAPCLQGYLRRPLLKALVNPQTLISKRGVTVVRYISDPWEGTKKTPHFVQPEKIRRGGHKIPWEEDKGMTAFENLKTKYIDTHSQLHTTLQEMKDQFRDASIPGARIDRFAELFFPKLCTAVVDVLGNFDDLNMYKKSRELRWPEHFKYYFTFGAHPSSAMAYSDRVHDKIVSIMSDRHCVAWGECGLDYFRTSPDEWPAQRRLLIRQLKSAVTLDKPVLILSKDSEKDTLAILRDHVPRNHRIHIQCFTASRPFGLEILSNWSRSSLGITGAITYTATRHVQDMIAEEQIPLNRILLGTKSPYMIPKNIYTWLEKAMPRSKKDRFVFSHSGMLPFIADAVAGCINRGLLKKKPYLHKDELVKMNHVLDATRINAEKFFGIVT